MWDAEREAKLLWMLPGLGGYVCPAPCTLNPAPRTLHPEP